MEQTFSSDVGNRSVDLEIAHILWNQLFTGPYSESDEHRPLTHTLHYWDAS
jgi:hypothetical protein